MTLGDIYEIPLSVEPPNIFFKFSYRRPNLTKTAIDYGSKKV